jgi:hypothetical protein
MKRESSLPCTMSFRAIARNPSVHGIRDFSPSARNDMEVKGNEAGILVTLHHVIPSDSEESLGTRHKGFLAFGSK